MTATGDNELLLRVFRVALQRIAEDPDGDVCGCEHDDEDCCEETGFYCPTCIAGKALAMDGR